MEKIMTVKQYTAKANKAIEIKKQIKALENEYNEIIADMLYSMENGLFMEMDTTLRVENATVSYCKEKWTTRVDKDKLVKDHPQLAKKYEKNSYTRATVRITIK